jgi:hypothetical protein
LAAHGGEFPMDCRICQTFTASPAEPGDLPEELAAAPQKCTLVWVDRNGKEEPLAAAPSDVYRAFRISPDGTRVP